MIGPSVLISGMGIAGPALAYWLLRYGFTPTLLERTPAPRMGGYVIDFWGSGYDVAERMGVLPRILEESYRVREVRFVDRNGRRTGGFDASLFKRATHGRFASLPRGALAAVLLSAVEGRVETILSDSLTSLDQDDEGVWCRFERAPARRFDLVVGADGLHSTVRGLAFGDARRYEKFLGYTVAAFEVAGYRPRDEDVYVVHAAPGRQITRFALRDDRTMVLLVMADDVRDIELHDARVQKAYLRTHFKGIGWECPALLAAMDRCDDLYFDRVSQIRLDRWSRGRVALVGDAAHAPSLLAGQGAALAMADAYVLAGELMRASCVEDAFVSYEQRLHPIIARKQVVAERLGSLFLPKTARAIRIRDWVTKAFSLPLVARAAFGGSLVDPIELADYENRRETSGTFLTVHV